MDKKPVMVEVKLKRDHTHRGKSLKPGDKIKVTEDQKLWLENIGIA